MEMTVTEIGAVVVAELRAAGYLESTIGQYAKTIKALSGYAGPGGVYSPELGAEFASRTISPRTGRFSPQRGLDYRPLTRVFDSYVRTGRVTCRCADAAAADRARRVPRWQRWTPGGRRTWLGGLAAATREAYGRVGADIWCSWSNAGSPAWTGPRRERAGVPGVAAGPVGEVVVVLGGVELPPVPEVHRPRRPGRRGEPGQSSRWSRPVIEVLGDAEAGIEARR